MFRENNNPDARHAFIAYTSGNGMAFQYRLVTGGQSYNTNVTGYNLPYYIKLVKTGSRYAGYVSQDSLVWKQIGTTVDLGFGATATCNAGLAFTSHDNTKLSTCVISKVPIVFSADTIVNLGGACPTVNVALNRPAASSGNLSTDKSIYEFRAFDGNAVTRWASAQGSDNANLFVDLGKRFNICKVTINWAAEYGKNFQVQVSDDALSWTTISTVTGNTALVNSLTVTGTGRFVRMLGTLRGTTLGYAINEMAVYGTAVAGQPANIALNKRAVSSTNENTTLIPAAAFDGNGSTRWASAGNTDPSWIYVDLGNTYNLSTIVLDWETALGADFQLQVSSDSLNWTTIKTVVANKAYMNALAVTGTGRYVRMLGTKRGYPAGYSLYEFEVYGVLASAALKAAVQLSKEDIVVYPNPASGIITINSGKAEMSGISITDVHGRYVRTVPMRMQHSVSVNIASLRAGIYFINIKTTTGVVTKKLVKDGGL
jgi:hypothetical protein